MLDNKNDSELFDLAVELIRRGTRYVDLINKLEAAGRPGADVRDILYRAGTFVDEVQKESLACSIEAFKKGWSFQNVCEALVKCGYHNWDAGTVAGRAQEKAAAELALETKTE